MKPWIFVIGLSLTLIGLISPQAGATPIDSVDLGDHRIELLSANVFDGEFYVWTYKVTSGTSPAISHWVLEICQAIFDHADGEVVTVLTNPDPTLGIIGVKFDDGFEDGEMRIVQIFLTAMAEVVEGDVGIKAGGDTYLGTITAPGCEIPEPATVILIGAGILGLATRRRTLF